MEREANYAAVGAFVLLVLSMAALFVYWYSAAHEHRSYTRYEIYFDGSVSGLTRGASVRYLGVDVGRVVRMSIDPRSASRVQVIADIDSTTPISDRTIAELSLQGLTGVLYIDLSQSPGERRLAEAVPGEEYPVIRSARSNFDVLLSSLPEMVALASGALERVDRVLSEQNIADLSRAFAHLDQATLELPQTLHEIRSLVADLRSTSGELRATAASVHAISADAAPRVRVAIERMASVADNLASATGQLDRLIAENRSNLRTFTRDSLPALERLLQSGQEATTEIRDLAQSLREDPSLLLYQTRPQGVEIPP
ncbi:MAG TPA: MlaD family protein [Steroidobacteraceae bacterium]|nr:MlaD family protein [Steroidobacteraceae bacterium]